MIKKFLQMMIGSLVCLATVAIAQPAPDQIKKLISDFMQQYHIPGMAVELYDHGKPASYYFGSINQQTKQPVTKDSIFELGSITKVFTTLLLAQQINDNKIKLSEPLTKDFVINDVIYLSSAKVLDGITLENLATHTAGFALNVPDDVNSMIELQHYFNNIEQLPKPGTQWQYSNVGIGLLGIRLETLLHESFNQMYRQRILQPLKMNEIGFLVLKKMQKDVATGYDKNGNPTTPAKVGIFPAAYAMKASSRDMLLFLKAALGLPGTLDAIQKAMQLTQTPFYQVGNMQQGLAWRITVVDKSKLQDLVRESSGLGPLPAKQLTKQQQVFNPNNLVEKSGSANGFRAYIAGIPAEQSGIVLLANHALPDGVLGNLGRQMLFAEIKQ